MILKPLRKHCNYRVSIAVAVLVFFGSPGFVLPADSSTVSRTADTSDPFTDDEFDSDEFLAGPESEPDIQEEEIPAAAPLPDPVNVSDVIESDGGYLRETIRERFENGDVKVERQVTQDKEQNYINHGVWIRYDQSGNKLAEGSYHFGKRHGEWMRLHDASSAKLFSTSPFNQFSGPYKSTATFEHGELHGEWMISDMNDRKICAWKFSHGRRHGKSLWYYVNAQPMREITYQDGELHGPLIEWLPDGTVVTEVKYINGRRLEKKTLTYTSGQKKAEGDVLRARLSLKDPDEWWSAKMATYTRSGKDEKHGEWTAWYENGQVLMKGEYQYNQPSGEFSWWHTNGQKSLLATFAAGTKEGVWTWWHENGQKSIHGSYFDGNPAGRWTWWKETGKVDKQIDYPATGAKHAVGATVNANETRPRRSILSRPNFLRPRSSQRSGTRTR